MKPVSWRARFLAAVAALGCTSCLPSARNILPPEVARQVSSEAFHGFGEPALWPEEALHGYRARLRLTAVGATILRGSIRIDEHLDGRLSGRLVLLDWPDGAGRERTVRTFPVSRADYDELRRRIAAAGLWRIYPQFWGYADSDSICVDGIEFYFERRDADGYRFATANAQCTAPAALLSVAEKFFDIAGEPRLHRWLE